MLNKITQFFTFGKIKDFQSLYAVVLALLGAPSFLVTTYFALMFANFIPELIHSINDGGITESTVYT